MTAAAQQMAVTGYVAGSGPVTVVPRQASRKRKGIGSKSEFFQEHRVSATNKGRDNPHG